ncbi:hypothetical protein Tco_0290936, partial [Tanacetum coccineum]
MRGRRFGPALECGFEVLGLEDSERGGGGVAGVGVEPVSGRGAGVVGAWGGLWAVPERKSAVSASLGPGFACGTVGGGIGSGVVDRYYLLRRVMIRKRRRNPPLDPTPAVQEKMAGKESRVNKCTNGKDSRQLESSMKDTNIIGKSTKGSKSYHKSAAGRTFKLMKGSCKSLVELEYFFEEVYNATTDQLDWNNPEGQQYLHDMRNPLPLIPNSQGRQVIHFDHFINND